MIRHPAFHEKRNGYSPANVAGQSSDFFDILIKEHQREGENLEVLISAANSIATTGFSQEPFSNLSTALRAISSTIRSQNEKEEKYLLPLLKHHAASVPSVMMEERKELWKVVDRLHQCVEDIEEGRIHASSVRELLQITAKLDQLLRSYLTKEQEILFPLLQQLLTPQKLKHTREESFRKPATVN